MARKFDELNLLSMDYEEYFGAMEISDSRKRRRIRLAEVLEDEIWAILALVAVQEAYSTVDWRNIQRQLEDAYMRVLNTDNSIDEHLSEYVSNEAAQIAQTTRDHINEEFYTSYDRARLIAENDANTIINYVENTEAVVQGKAHKTWCTMLDERVRHSHLTLEGKTIPIGGIFEVGDSLMQYPRDESLGASVGEIANCRCSLRYS